MRYKKDHKQASRKDILCSALRLFSHKGFDNVSIDEIMADAGLTRGAFYAHFENKQQLYSEAILSAGMEKVQDTNKIEDSKKLLKQRVAEYLEVNNSNPDDMPCPLAYLVTDVANREPDVRAAYTKGYQLLNANVKKLLSDNVSEIDEQSVMAMTSMMIGGVAIARAVPGPVAKKILKGCKKTVFEIIEKA